MWRVKTVTKFKNSFFPVLIYWNNNRIHLNILGKPQHKKSTVQTVFVQIAFQPPHPQANGRFVGAIFAENLSIF